jgi:hypothetical protein
MEVVLARARRVSASNDPRGWVRTGKTATTVFLRTTKRITAYKEVGGSLRLLKTKEVA